MKPYVDTDWSDPYHYDIKITKSGKGKETEYSVNPVPHKPLDPYIKQQFMETPCNLEALFDGNDPFALGWASYTSFGCGEIDAPIIEEETEVLSKDLQEKLSKIIEMCSFDTQEKIWDELEPYCSHTRDLSLLSRVHYSRFKNLVLNYLVQDKSSSVK